MAVIGNIIANLGINSSSWTSGIDTAQKSTGKFQNSINAMSVAAGIAIDRLASKIASVGPKLIGMASEAQEMQNKFGVVFGKLSGPAEAFADKLAHDIGRSRYEMRGFAADLMDTFKPLGFAEGEAFKLTKTVQQLGLDLASFYDQSDGEAIQRLIGGLIGNHENLRSYGVIINENALKNELLSMGIDGVTRAATEQEKVIARLNLIMKGTVDAQGDAMRSWDSFANVLKNVQGMAKDAGIDIGLHLIKPMAEGLIQVLPLLKDLSIAAVSVTGSLSEMAKSASGDFPKGIMDTTKTVDGLVSGVGMVADAWQGVHAIFKTIQGAMTKGISNWLSVVGTMVETVEGLLNKIPGVEIAISDTIKTISQDLDKLSQEQFAKAGEIADRPLASKTMLEDLRKARAEAEKINEVAVPKTGNLMEGLQEAWNMIDFTPAAQNGLQNAMKGVKDWLTTDIDTKSEKPGGPSTIRKNSREFFEYAATMGSNPEQKKQVELLQKTVGFLESSNKWLQDMATAAPAKARTLNLT